MTCLVSGHCVKGRGRSIYLHASASPKTPGPLFRFHYKVHDIACEADSRLDSRASFTYCLDNWKFSRHPARPILKKKSARCLPHFSSNHPYSYLHCASPVSCMHMSEARSLHRIQTPAPSWRRTVADALAMAQSAVELDATNMDPSGALVAYTESVRRLRSIRARLERHGALADARQLASIVRLTPPSPPSVMYVLK